MKNKLKELNVDFIGGQEPLTKEEELAISLFIKKDKKERKVKIVCKLKVTASQKVHQLA